jgi:hypothetical protein
MSLPSELDQHFGGVPNVLRSEEKLAKLILPFGGGSLPLCCPAPLNLRKSFRAQAERRSGIGLKLFGFIAESVFTFIPESCSDSPRNTVQNHPGIAFTFDRIPHT